VRAAWSLLLIGCLAARARADDLMNRVYVVRIETEQALGASTARRTLAAPALPVGPGGLLMVVGFAVSVPDRSEREAVKVSAIAPDGRRLAAEIVGADEDRNCTFFKVEGAPAPVPLTTVALQAGDAAVLLGRYGDTMQHQPLRRAVVIDAVTREPRVRYALRDPSLAWRGAIAATQDGRLVGFVDIAPTIEDGEGAMLGVGAQLPVVVPASEFAEAAKTPAGKRQGKAWLGVNLAPFDENREAYFSVGSDWKGALVTGFADGSPAAAAGIQLHDLIQTIGPLAIRFERQADWGEMLRAVQRLPLGTALPCRIVRFVPDGAGGFTAREITVQLEIGERPIDFADAPETEIGDLGISVKPATSDWLRGLRLPTDTRGVVVTRLKRGSAAGLGGLLPNDLILRLDRQPVPDVAALQARLAEARNERRERIVLFIRRGNETAFVAVSPQW